MSSFTPTLGPDLQGPTKDEKSHESILLRTSYVNSLQRNKILSFVASTEFASLLQCRCHLGSEGNIVSDAWVSLGGSTSPSKQHQSLDGCRSEWVKQRDPVASAFQKIVDRHFFGAKNIQNVMVCGYCLHFRVKEAFL